MSVRVDSILADRNPDPYLGLPRYKPGYFQAINVSYNDPDPNPENDGCIYFKSRKKTSNFYPISI